MVADSSPAILRRKVKITYQSACVTNPFPRCTQASINIAKQRPIVTRLQRFPFLFSPLLKFGVQIPNHSNPLIF